MESIQTVATQIEFFFSGKLEEDVLRRDFTMNALAYHPQRGLVDYVGGKEAILQKKICCVGSPYKRFDEDALRILRGWRFAAQLGFRIDEETKAGMIAKMDGLRKVSVERIQVELLKIMTSSHPEYIVDMIEDKTFFYCILEVYEYGKSHLKWRQQLGVYLQKTRSNIYLIFALLLGWMEDKKEIEGIFRRLHFDNETRKISVSLIQVLQEPQARDIIEYRKQTSRYGVQIMQLYLAYQEIVDTHNISRIDRQRQWLEEIIINQNPLRIKDLAIGGKDLLDIGYEQGDEIGKALEFLLEEVLVAPKKNQRDILLSLALEKRIR